MYFSWGWEYYHGSRLVYLLTTRSVSCRLGSETENSQGHSPPWIEVPVSWLLQKWQHLTLPAWVAGGTLPNYPRSLPLSLWPACHLQAQNKTLSDPMSSSFRWNAKTRIFCLQQGIHCLKSGQRYIQMEDPALRMRAAGRKSSLMPSASPTVSLPSAALPSTSAGATAASDRPPDGCFAEFTYSTSLSFSKPFQDKRQPLQSPIKVNFLAWNLLEHLGILSYMQCNTAQQGLSRCVCHILLQHA